MFAGLVISEWAALEDNLALMFAMLTGEIVSYNGNDYSTKPNPALVASLNVLESLSARLDIISASLSITLTRKQCDEFETIRKDIRRCSSGRNAIAHGVWAVCDKYPNDGLILEKGTGRYIRWTKKDFEREIRAIARQSYAITQFHLKCHGSLVEKALEEETRVKEV